MLLVVECPFSQFFFFLNYLFYNDYETSYTIYINHARWHWCLLSGGLCVGGNRNTRRKPTCLTWWPHDHLTCRCRVLNPVAAVRGERFTTTPARKPLFQYIAVFSYNTLISNIKYILQNRTESWKWHQTLKFVSECFFVKLLTYKCFVYVG